MLQPNPMSLSCLNKTSTCRIRSRNQTGVRVWHVFPLLSLLLRQCNFSAHKYGWLQHLNVPCWLSCRCVYVFIYVNIMLMCFSACRLCPIVPFKFDVRWLMQPWCEVAASVVRVSESSRVRPDALDTCHWLKRGAGVWKVSLVLSWVAFQENAS